MARKYLGETFDIHGGGIDNIFPHNECEIAQSEAANGQPFARFWMLVGSLTLDGVKMSKSLGNTLTIDEALRRWRPEAIRTFVLSSHYSSPIDFSNSAVDSAHKGWQRLYGAVSLIHERQQSAPDGEANDEILAMLGESEASFLAKMDDDFNAPAALATLHDLTRKVNSLLAGEKVHSLNTLEAMASVYDRLGGDILGIFPADLMAGGAVSASAEREAGLMRMLIKLRAQARENKDWATADMIRDRLDELGIALEDRPEGTMWKAN
jgi:cysteinyl-tRNA synthetase